VAEIFNHPDAEKLLNAIDNYARIYYRGVGRREVMESEHYMKMVDKCREELAALRGLLREAEGLIKAVAKERCFVLHLDRQDGVKHLLTQEAAALLLRIEAALNQD
jgi:hypothetical protein